MEVRSEVPATEFDLANERPFEFTIDKYFFTVQPLSLHDYYAIEKKLNMVLSALYYYGVDLNKDLATFLKIDSEHITNIKNSENIIKILIRLLQPINPIQRAKMIMGFNLKYRYKPSKWVWSLYGWLEKKMSLSQVQDLASWFMRYCSELKKKIFLTLRQGIESATKLQKAMNQDLSDFIDEGWKQGYKAAGLTILGLPEH
jgi:hypothetical protein